jgi:hypothetical protein
MTTKGSPEEISRPTDIGAPKRIEPEEERPPPGQGFETFMKEGTEKPTGRPGEVSPFELAGGKAAAGAGPTMESIQAQMHSTSSVIGDLQNQLHTKNLKLKQSQKYLLRNKLSSANENIHSAAENTGIEKEEPPSTTLRQSPITKFLALLTDGQNQLDKTNDMIQTLNSTGQMMEPGKLLLVQVKLAKAQQELEYSSVLLGKAVDDIKTMFNIQL